MPLIRLATRCAVTQAREFKKAAKEGLKTDGM